MPEKHPEASTTGRQFLDGTRSPWLASQGNPAMSPQTARERHRHPRHTDKISEKRGLGRRDAQYLGPVERTERQRLKGILNPPKTDLHTTDHEPHRQPLYYI